MKYQIFLLLTTYYLLHTTYVDAVTQAPPKQPVPIGDVIPAKPGIDISQFFGFGDIASLGESTSRLVAPIFSLAMFLVLLYFLVGSFKYLRAGSNKEEVEGARFMIEHAIFGFILLMAVFLVLQFLLSSLFSITDFQIIK